MSRHYMGDNAITRATKDREMFRQKSEDATNRLARWWYDMRCMRAAKKVRKYRKQLGG